jgi:hypothetical protein
VSRLEREGPYRGDILKISKAERYNMGSLGGYGERGLALRGSEVIERTVVIVHARDNAAVSIPIETILAELYLLTTSSVIARGFFSVVKTKALEQRGRGPG